MKLRQKIRVGTRASNLALKQALIAINKLKSAWPDIEFEIVKIVTSGDKITDKNLYNIGGKALFLKELEKKLLDGEIDIAVHSLKDVPGYLPDQLEIAAVIEREDPSDVLISYKYKSLDEIKDHQDKGVDVIVATSSVRRRAIASEFGIKVSDMVFRGSIETRLEKIKAQKADVTFLAMAGLARLNIFDKKYCHILNPQIMLPAAGQGVIAFEIRCEDVFCKNILSKINHIPTMRQIVAERSFLKYLNADCDAPIAAYVTDFEDNKLIGNYCYYINNKPYRATIIDNFTKADEFGALAAKKMGL